MASPWFQPVFLKRAYFTFLSDLSLPLKITNGDRRPPSPLTAHGFLSKENTRIWTLPPKRNFHWFSAAILLLNLCHHHPQPSTLAVSLISWNRSLNQFNFQKRQKFIIYCCFFYIFYKFLVNLMLLKSTILKNEYAYYQTTPLILSFALRNNDEADNLY